MGKGLFRMNLLTPALATRPSGREGFWAIPLAYYNTESQGFLAKSLTVVPEERRDNLLYFRCQGIGRLRVKIQPVFFKKKLNKLVKE